MSEEKQVRKQLLKNALLNLIAFTIIFTILGISIYSQFKNSLYLSADSELERANTRKEFRIESEDRLEQRPSFPEEQEILEVQNKLEKLDEQEKNPRLVFINRDSNGSISQEEYLNDIFKNASFDKTNLNKIYEITISNYSYRGINYQNQDGTYTQVLINIDSEKTIAEKFIKNLVISFSISLVIILVASYVLSKWTMKPIVISWRKQTRFVQDASHELRTPLTIIKAKQESLLENPESKIIDNAEDISITLQETREAYKAYKRTNGTSKKWFW